MRDLFPGHYRPDVSTLRQMMQSATVILDSSSLLNLYRYPEKARKDLLAVLYKFSDRLWIPYQVALEFQENRLSVISDQVSRFKEVKDITAKLENTAKTQLDKLQLDKRHSSIDPRSFMSQISRAVKEFAEKLDELEKAHPDMYQDDEIRSQLDDIYSGKVGAPPSADLLKRVDEEGPKRYRSQVPPGYKDDAKDGEVYAYGGRTIEKRYGDLLIWFQIIEEAQLKSIKDIILVTDDEKEDWWWIVASLGKKTIGPRPELIEEIMSQAGVGSFYMYNSERFLRFAAEQLGVKIERESVEQVGDVARSYSRDLPSNMEARVRDALKVWLSAQFETVIEVGGFPDFVAFDHATGLHHGFEIRKTDESLGELRTALKVLNKQRAKVPLDDLTFVVVADNQQEAEMSRRLFARRIVHALPPDVRLVVGAIFGDPQTFVQVGDALG